MWDFSDRVVMITGAAGNLGSAVARAFHSAGAHLVLVDRAPDRLPAMFPELTNSPDHYLATSMDLMDADAAEQMVQEARQRLGRIDVLVHTVGGYRGGQPVHETPLETWQDLFDLNVRTALTVTRAVVPVMVAQRAGRLVYVAAKAGLEGGKHTAAYSAAKSALLRLMESLAAELRGTGITVNGVLPSTIDTPQNRAAMPKADPTRWVKPEAIADVILFLASDAARAVHGAAIPVYGAG
ncbi:MAG: SDR family NAD(P)-dependent oxidoreductase [Anaerolineae bacterium]|nr:SDR family oxidoreductase [Anaerolineae bacterium]MDW8067912.1 SDR family NAD(P)-dependent oxidoreductase [Anaerolineae bacterium]